MPDKDAVVEGLTVEVLALRHIVQMLIAYGNVPTGGKLNKYLQKVADDAEHRDERAANKAIADAIRSYIQ
ncbi:hypothetical protein [Erwinia mallotivora]|uniref:Uncharacterized protein n=1 Tax=Erwinia mallotivora TaxID=69222 RepID=A0A014LYY9_9GAMM|nr:hypothetical protein [Erwinia mallotivora]EXU74771.1 hypothetical protein BG55_13540 [Erwinia mallotivora]